MAYTYHAYEDGAGGLHLFALAEDGAPVWGDYYYLEALRRCKGKWEMYW